MMNTPVTPEMLQEKDREINELNDTISEQERKLKRNNRVYEDGRIKSSGDLTHKIRDLKRPIAMYYSCSQSSKGDPISVELGECFKQYLNTVCNAVVDFYQKSCGRASYVWVAPDEYSVPPIDNDYSNLSQDELLAELSKKNEIISDKKETVSMFKKMLDEVDSWERFKYCVNHAYTAILGVLPTLEHANGQEMDDDLAEWYREAFFSVTDCLYEELDLKEACEEFREFL